MRIADPARPDFPLTGTPAGQEPRRGNSRAQRGRGKAQRRQFLRVPVSLPVIGRAPQFHGAPLHGTVRSVGTGGVMVEFPVALVRDSTLRITLQTALGPLEVEGRVVWTSVTRGVVRHGVAFAERKTPHLAIEPPHAEDPTEEEDPA